MRNLPSLLVLWGSVSLAVGQPLDDLVVNRWVKVQFQCSGGDPEYAGGCPSSRGWIQLAYDQRRKHIVLFGGSGEWYFNDLWYYHPQTRKWTMVIQDTRLAGQEKDWSQYPKGRDNHQLVYDPQRDVYWMYGGTSGGGFWMFDPKDRTWTVLERKHDGKRLPIVTLDPGFAYSAHHEGILLFGGNRWAPGEDTWWFDAVERKWTQLRPEPSPPARAQVENALTYDTVRKQFILFGGRAPAKKKLGDTWIYDPSDGSWTNMKPPVSPPARDRHIVVFDQKNGVAILLGAHKDADTWIYDPDENQWQELVTARGDYPAKDSYVVSAAYVPDLDMTVFRDVRGRIYYLRLDLSRDLSVQSEGPPPTLELP